MANFIEWNINDPNVPVVVKEEIKALPGPGAPVSVFGFDGTASVPGTIQAQGASVYMSIAYALDMVNRLNNGLPKWSRTNVLLALPRAGMQFNAYYDGSTLRFFYNTHPRTGVMIYACDSSDVVTHELGHALLDAWRPDLWSTMCVEVLSFHESFGDIMSIVSALSHTEMIDYVLKETKGDISKSNAISKIAEQLGDAISPGASSLRDAVNNFMYISPESLPSAGPSDKLCREPHSYSRLFTGAFYDLIVWLFRENSKNLPPREALMRSRDGAMAAILNGITTAPNNAKFYKSVAVGMVGVGDLLTRQGVIEVFSARGIIDSPQPTLSVDSPNTMTLTGPIIGSTLTVKLVDHLKMADSSNPLYYVDVDIPNDGAVECGEDGTMRVAISTSLNDTLAAAKSCLDYLNDTDRVAYKENEMKEYSVVDGKLVRNYIHCFCHRK